MPSIGTIFCEKEEMADPGNLLTKKFILTPTLSDFWNFAASRFKPGVAEKQADFAKNWKYFLNFKITEKFR